MSYQVIILTDIADYNLGYGKYAGSYKIATEVRQSGYTCQVIDNYTYMGLDKLKILLDKFVGDNTLLIGISCALNNKTVNGKHLHWGYEEQDFLNILGDLKNKYPNLNTVAGGPRIQENQSWNNIDYTILSKGEKSIVALLNHITQVTELKYNSLGHTKVIKEIDYPYTQEEFSTSIIQYEHNDIIFENEALPLEIARGCIFACAFCKYDLIGKRIGDWTKTPETIRNEMIRNYEMFGTTHYNISDELINESLEKLRMVRDVIVSLPFEVSYTAYARIDLIWRYPEMRELFLESNAKCLIFGIETLHEKAGKAIGKGLSSDKVKETLQYCKELWDGKILMCSNFIVGLPHEPKEHILETVEYMLGDDSPLDIYTFTPLLISEVSDKNNNSSKIEKNPEKYGYKITEISNWSGSQMTKKESVELCNKIDLDPRMQRMNVFRTFKWFGRAKSLGYDIDSFFKVIKDKKTNHLFYKTEIAIKTRKMKDLYYTTLLNHDIT
jgi:radical SAM superfamily enzyme YgiQ (UPF0313 family)